MTILFTVVTETDSWDVEYECYETFEKVMKDVAKEIGVKSDELEVIIDGDQVHGSEKVVDRLKDGDSVYFLSI